MVTHSLLLTNEIQMNRHSNQPQDGSNRFDETGTDYSLLQNVKDVGVEQCWHPTVIDERSRALGQVGRTDGHHRRIADRRLKDPHTRTHQLATENRSWVSGSALASFRIGSCSATRKFCEVNCKKYVGCCGPYIWPGSLTGVRREYVEWSTITLGMPKNIWRGTRRKNKA